MSFDRRLEFYRRQLCQRRQESGVSQGQCLAPTSSATTVAMQALFMSIMGSVSSSSSRRPSRWDLQCQPGPGHTIICKRICCSRVHARAKAPIHSQDMFIDVYQCHRHSLSTRSETCSTLLHSAQAAAVAFAEVQAAHARPAQMQTFDANDVYVSITGSDGSLRFRPV